MCYKCHYTLFMESYFHILITGSTSCQKRLQASAVALHSWKQLRDLISEACTGTKQTIFYNNTVLLGTCHCFCSFSRSRPPPVTKKSTHVFGSLLPASLSTTESKKKCVKYIYISRLKWKYKNIQNLLMTFTTDQQIYICY